MPSRCVTEVEAYAADGQPVGARDPMAVAVRQGKLCWALRAVGGAEPCRLYNPREPNRERTSALPPYEMMPVSRAAFEAYRLFLQTDNLAHLRVAERE